MITPQQIVAIGIRLFSIFLGIRFLYIFGLLFSNPQAPGNAMTFVLALLGLIVAIGLWFFPLSVAHRLIPRTSHDNQIGGNTFEIARIGACLIGLWYFAHGITNLCSFAYYAIALSGVGESFFRTIGAEHTGQFVLYLGELVVSVLIMKQAAWFAGRICGQGGTRTPTDAP